MSPLSKYPKANVLGVGIDAVDMGQALERIAEKLASDRKGYICFTGVHGVMEAQRSHELKNILANASLVLPDGTPTVWVGRHQGNASMRRVFGPDLMLEILQREEFRNRTHFFCGGKAGIAQELRERLQERFPHVRIVGSYTPPFGPMSPAEEGEFLGMVRSMRPDIVWVGMSTPKQDRFMAQYLPLLDTCLMFGVGAAFDYHTGRISDCADWVKRCGLQWFHRLLQDPWHLWKRYLRNNPAFIWAIGLQLTGLRTYPIQSRFNKLSVTPDVVPSAIEAQLR
jgi:N-acetylglucosaminyldiphosphoundecaprenol N-acetyl-beta-D-mannosaminyltransferase